MNAKFNNVLNAILGSLGKETRSKNERKVPAMADEKIGRSALIGIKPEEIATTGKAGQLDKNNLSILQCALSRKVL